VVASPRPGRGGRDAPAARRSRDHPPAGCRRREGDGTGPGRLRHYHRLPGHRPQQLRGRVRDASEARPMSRSDVLADAGWAEARTSRPGLVLVEDNTARGEGHIPAATRSWLTRGHWAGVYVVPRIPAVRGANDPTNY